jgi:hypothetical protein
VLRHQFGQNLIFGLDLLLQILDAFLLGLVVGSALVLKDGWPVLEELFLPAVQNGWLEPQLVTQLRDRLLVQQMPPQDGDLFLCGVVLSWLLQAFSPLS